MEKIKKVIKQFLHTIFKGQVFEIRSGLSKGLKRRFGLGFKPRLFLTKEEKFLATLDFSGKVVFDLGAYVGMYSLFFARAVGFKGKVFAFEPNPKNYNELIFNVKLNGFKNIKSYKLAVGENRSKMNLVVPVYPTRGTLNSKIQKGILKKGSFERFSVEVDSIDNLIKKQLILEPDFIKIDVEGFEISVLKGAEKTILRLKPVLFIEIHGILNKELVSFLLNKTYLPYHIESDTKITSLKYPFIKDGHLYCKPYNK